MKKIVYKESDFRMYEPEESINEKGEKVYIQLCETLESGRWEPFYSYISKKSYDRYMMLNRSENTPPAGY